jgi:hypothetical protein
VAVRAVQAVVETALRLLWLAVAVVPEQLTQAAVAVDRRVHSVADQAVLVALV